MNSKSSLLRDISQFFDNYEKRERAIHQVDKYITNTSVSINDILAKLPELFIDLFNPYRLGLYCIIDESVIEIQNTSILTKSPLMDNYNDLAKIICSRTTNDCTPVKLNQVNGFNGVTILLPISIDESNNHYVVTVMQDETPFPDSSWLVTDTAMEYFHKLAYQLGILLRLKIKSKIEIVKDTLTDDYFRYRLDPDKRWGTLINKVSNFLPEWSPVNISPAPQVQILTYSEGDTHLLLRATRGKIHSDIDLKSDFIPDGGLPIHKDECVCGLCIKENESFININPSREQFKKYYKQFLYNCIPKSELVIPIKYEAKIIGVLNLEHENENIFTGYHVDLMLKVASTIAPFVQALSTTEKEKKSLTISNIYAMSKFLDRVSAVHRHKVAQSITISSQQLGNLEEIFQENINKFNEEDLGFLTKSIELIQRHFENFRILNDHFMKSLPNYVSLGKINLNSIIKSCIQEFDLDRRLEDSEIEIMYSPCGKEISIYGSSFLGEHIYNILNNSVYQIKKSIQEDKINKGIITVTTSVYETTDLKNEGHMPNKVLISIKDNGGGVDPVILEKIKEFGFSTKGENGSGLGIPAAIQYARSIRGDIFLDNYGEGFQVDFILEEWSEYHTNISNE